MYRHTSSAFDWLTENIPYPACQWKSANSIPFVLIHRDDGTFTNSTVSEIDLVRERPKKDVVRHAADPERRAVVVRQGDGQIGKQFLPTVGVQNGNPILGAEDKMDEHTGERLGHEFAP
jgi:hypothetical protein